MNFRSNKKKLSFDFNKFLNYLKMLIFEIETVVTFNDIDYRF